MTFIHRVLLGNKDVSEYWKIPLYKIFTDDEDINLITKIVKRGSDWTNGPEIAEFENYIKKYVGTEYCLTFNSGTSALHATLLAYKFKKSDEVVVPSFSFIATANSVLFVDSKPIFADIEESNFGLDPVSIQEKISPNTKAIIPMDYGGLSCKIFEIRKIANDNHVVLIEDAAESLGSAVKGKKAGSVADSAIFSFCGNKVLTTGEGGAVVTNSRDIYEKLKLIRSHGRSEKISYMNDPSRPQYVELGYNWRMSTITAALGISQLKKLDKIIQMRQQNADYISSRIKKFSQIKVPASIPGYENIYQMYTIVISDNKIRNELHNFLSKKRIFTKIYFDPIHLSSFYREKFGTKEGLLPVTERIANQVLTLPIYPNMTNEDKDYLVESIAKFFEGSN